MTKHRLPFQDWHLVVGQREHGPDGAGKWDRGVKIVGTEQLPDGSTHLHDIAWFAPSDHDQAIASLLIEAKSLSEQIQSGELIVTFANEQKKSHGRLAYMKRLLKKETDENAG